MVQLVDNHEMGEMETSGGLVFVLEFGATPNISVVLVIFKILNWLSGSPYMTGLLSRIDTYVSYHLTSYNYWVSL